jgi:hypothetical protein
MEADSEEEKRGWGKSGGFELCPGQHLAGQIDELIHGEWAAEDANCARDMGGGICIGRQTVGGGDIWIGEDENRHLWQSGVEFGDEGRSTDALHGVRSNDKSKLLGELRLLDQAESLGGIGDASHILKLAFQNGFAQNPLEGIAFND